MAIDRRTLTAVSLLAVIFASGFAIGVVVDRTWMREDAIRMVPPPMPPGRIERRLAQFRERLNLTDEQVDQIEAILRATHEEVTSMHERIEPKMRGIRERSRSQIRAILTAEQAAEYDEMSAEFEARFREKFERMRRGWPGDRPGRRGKRNFGKLFDKLDGDGDGALTRDECERSDRPMCDRVLRRFDALDKNGDSTLSRDEFGALRRMRRPRPPP